MYSLSEADEGPQKSGRGKGQGKGAGKGRGKGWGKGRGKGRGRGGTQRRGQGSGSQRRELHAEVDPVQNEPSHEEQIVVRQINLCRLNVVLPQSQDLY